MQKMCPLPERQSGLGNFFPAIRAAVGWGIFFPSLSHSCRDDQTRQRQSGQVWSHQKQGGRLEAGLRTGLSGTAPAEIRGEGIAPVFSFPILVTVREQWWGSAGSMDQPLELHPALLGPVHRAGSWGSALQKLLFPPLKLLVRQRNNSSALGDSEKGPICLAF